MPNRILKETICTSEDLAKISQGAEILFYRLMVKADDFGAYYGNESIIKSTCFPLKSDEIKCDQVKAWLIELVNAGLIYHYIAEDGRKYIQLVKWDKHQQIRAKKRKFPQFDINCNQMISDDINCDQMKSIDNNCSRNPIQSNTIQSESNTRGAAAPQHSQSFKPPTLEEVTAYCAERNNSIDPQAFIDYYAGSNWFRGKTKIKDWKACIRTWEQREKNNPSSDNPAQKKRQYLTAEEYKQARAHDKPPASPEELMKLVDMI